jgi:hypothetical protein
MNPPIRVGLTTEDIDEFFALIDAMPHGHARHLETWMNKLVTASAARERQTEAELDELRRHIEAEDAAAKTPEAAIERVLEHYETMCAPPATSETRH